MNVYDFAIQVEQRGRAFYRALAARAATPGVGRIFTMMAKDEQALMERFRAMKAGSRARMEDSAVLERLGNAFLRLFDESEALGITSDLEAYGYVLNVERGICRLYEEAAEREKIAEVKELLLRVASEERRELESMQEVYDFVRAPNEYLAWGEFSNLGEFHNFGRSQG